MFKRYDQKQQFLLPLNLEEFVSEDHISRVLRNDENIISIFLSPILSLMVIWGNGIIEPFPK